MCQSGYDGGMSETDDDERQLRMKLMRADIDLKTRQAFWETPRNLALIIAAVAGVAGVLGFKLGQREPLSIPPQVIFQPGSIVVQPAQGRTP
jgi:hypothetical protein